MTDPSVPLATLLPISGCERSPSSFTPPLSFKVLLLSEGSNNARPRQLLNAFDSGPFAADYIGDEAARDVNANRDWSLYRGSKALLAPILHGINLWGCRIRRRVFYGC